MSTESASTAGRPVWIPSRTAGRVGVWAGVIGVVAGLVLIGYPAAVTDDQYSYPFTATGFTVTQVVLTARDLGLAVVLAAVWTSGAAGRAVLGRIGVGGSVLAMLALAAMEVVSIVVKDADGTGAGYGLASIAIGVFAILAGIAVLHARIWTGWQRFLLLALGIYVFVPLTPGILGGFALGQIVIAGWMALFAVLGWALAGAPRRTTDPAGGPEK